MSRKSCLLLLRNLIASVCTTPVFGGLTRYWSEPKPPINLYADIEHEPFFHGVASGDPLPEFVILWTRVTPRTASEVELGVEVSWQVWLDDDDAPVLEGNGTALPERDFTVKVDAGPLPRPNTTYFYRFFSPLNETSRTGRTRTAPLPNSDGGKLTFAVTSCSQHQMYLNGYAHLAHNYSFEGEVLGKNFQETEAVSAVLHLGDFLYDTNEKTTWQRTWTGSCETSRPDLARDIENREILLDPAFQPHSDSFMNCSWFEPNKTFEYWRFRHSENHMDPDLRDAMAAHPWIIIIDSHDGDLQGTMRTNEALYVFEWWTPTRWTMTTDSFSGLPTFRMFRSFRFGNLATVIALDARDIGEEAGEPYWGLEQRDFFRAEVAASSSGWRVIMCGKVIAPWRIDSWAGYVTGIAVLLLFLVGLLVMICVCFRRRHQHHVRDQEKNNEREKKLARLWTCCFGCGIVTFLCVLAIWLAILILGRQTLRSSHQVETGVLNPFATDYNPDGHPVDRAETLKDLADASAFSSGNIFVTGDMHMLAVSNLRQTTEGIQLKEEIFAANPGRNLMNVSTLTEKEDRVAVEFLPSSTSSRNIDDFFVARVPFQGMIDLGTGIVQRAIVRDNLAHFEKFDAAAHGMGYLHLAPDETRLLFYSASIFFPFETAKLAWEGKIKNGTNTVETIR